MTNLCTSFKLWGLFMFRIIAHLSRFASMPLVIDMKPKNFHVPIRTIVRNVPRLPNSPTNVEEGNLSRPIRTSHNSHTNTDNNRQSESQLKECSCSSAILSHNSRDVIPSHNPRNVTCLSPIMSHNSRDIILSHNSRNTPTSLSLRYHPNPCRLRTSKHTKAMPLYFCLAVLYTRQAKFHSRPLGSPRINI